MDNNGKSRHSVWLSDDVWREVDALYKLCLLYTSTVIPLVVTAALAFLCIRHGGVSMLDFLRYAAAFFFFGQQYYEWRERV